MANRQVVARGFTAWDLQEFRVKPVDHM
jgi:hypothetical protein